MLRSAEKPASNPTMRKFHRVGLHLGSCMGALRNRHNKCRDSHHEAASGAAAPRDDGHDAGRRRQTPATASRAESSATGDDATALRCAASGRPVNCLTHGAVATWIAPSSRPTTAPAPTQSDLSNNRITHDEAAAPPPARHVAIRARAAGRRRRTGDDDHEQGGDTTATSKRRAGGGTYRKGGEATATTEGGAPRRRRPWMIGRAWRRRRGEQGGRPRAAAPRPCPPRDHALAASPLARGA